MSDKLFDFIAVGLGPFNLSLACLTEPLQDLDGLFLEQAGDFDWHSGMMMEWVTMQTPFLSDLVTLADPTNRFSFLNYAKLTGKLYSFYIREDFFLLRREYSQYCNWAARQLNNVLFEHRVEMVTYDEAEKAYRVETSRGVFRARKLVLGTGTSPYVPDCCRGLEEDVFHSSQYTQRKASLSGKRAVTIVGSGQSAAEIFYDLLQEIDLHRYELNWITRSERFFPLDYSKLTLEMTSPEYVDYFHHLPLGKRDELVRKHKHLYKGISGDLIAQIRDLLYAKRVHHEFRCNLLANSQLIGAESGRSTGSLALTFRQNETDREFHHETEALILATGYRYQVPEFLDGIASRLEKDESGRFDVARNYSIDRNRSEVFVQNAELHTHGFVSPDLGMGCYRNAYIIRELTGREVYPVETRIGFQTYDAEDGRVGFLTESEQ